MDHKIKELRDQGVGRNEIFEQLRKEASNEMRLAQKLATFEHCQPSGMSKLLNRILMTVCLLQSSFAIWAIYSNVVPLDEEFGWQGIVATVILTTLYFIGIVRMSFTGYASFILFCVAVVATYVYFFAEFPVTVIVGVFLGVAGGALSYMVKVRLFPHMGLMDVRKDEDGAYILE